MRIVSGSHLRSFVARCACAALPLAGCAQGALGRGADLPKQLLASESSVPALFMGSDPSAPAVGFLGKDVKVDVAGPSVSGRVPVRVHGAMLVRGYVPEVLLSLRAQRHGKVRGAPVYLGPNDPVMVLGRSREAGRLRVRVAPRLDGVNLPAFEGSYPEAGVAATQVTAPEPLPAGEAYELPKGTPLALYEAPDGPLVTELPACDRTQPVTVLSKQGTWFAVRIGSGPYLIGYTNAYLAPHTTPPLSASSEQPPATPVGRAGTPSDIPERLVNESGELKRVAQGAAVSFGDKVFAKLQKPGYARVLAVYPSGEADALVAVDDDVVVRGLVRGADLSAPAASGVQRVLD